MKWIGRPLKNLRGTLLTSARIKGTRPEVEILSAVGLYIPNNTKFFYIPNVSYDPNLANNTLKTLASTRMKWARAQVGVWEY